MTYDPGKILPNLACPNCGTVGLMQIVGSDIPGGVVCNQCGQAAASPQNFIAAPTTDFPPE
jgi:hypothetical protein